MFNLPSLFPHLQVVESPAPERSLKRHRHHACDTRFVRKVKGKQYQLRLWIGANKEHPWFSIHCGLYPSEEMARTAKTGLVHELQRIRGPLTPYKIWLAVKPLQAKGLIPKRVLPLWVFAIRKGSRVRYGARIKRQGLNITLPHSYGTPDNAHLALVARLRELFQKDEPEEEVIDLEWHFRRFKQKGCG